MIMEALIFLGFQTEDYNHLKMTCGGVDGLYDFLVEKLGA